MADELFLQASNNASARRFERRLGLATSDARKSCGSRFLSNLESAIFRRGVAASGEREHEEDLSGLSFPRRDPVRG